MKNSSTFLGLITAIGLLTGCEKENLNDNDQLYPSDVSLSLEAGIPSTLSAENCTTITFNQLESEGFTFGDVMSPSAYESEGVIIIASSTGGAQYISRRGGCNGLVGGIASNMGSSPGDPSFLLQFPQEVEAVSVLADGYTGEHVIITAYDDIDGEGNVVDSNTYLSNRFLNN